MCKNKLQLCLGYQPCFTIQILIRFPKYSPLVAPPVSPTPNICHCLSQCCMLRQRVKALTEGVENQKTVP